MRHVTASSGIAALSPSNFQVFCRREMTRLWRRVYIYIVRGIQKQWRYQILAEQTVSSDAGYKQVVVVESGWL